MECGANPIRVFNPPSPLCKLRALSVTSPLVLLLINSSLSFLADHAPSLRATAFHKLKYETSVSYPFRRWKTQRIGTVQAVDKLPSTEKDSAHPQESSSVLRKPRRIEHHTS